MGASDMNYVQLKFDQHLEASFNNLAYLRDKQVYTDLTLSCCGAFYPAHRLVVSSCSEYLARSLQTIPAFCPYPVILLDGLDRCTLEALLTFMYDGLVAVHKDHLSTVLKAGQRLGIKGLSQMCPEAATGPSGAEREANTAVSREDERKKKKLEGEGHEIVHDDEVEIISDKRCPIVSASSISCEDFKKPRIPHRVRSVSEMSKQAFIMQNILQDENRMYKEKHLWGTQTKGNLCHAEKRGRTFQEVVLPIPKRVKASENMHSLSLPLGSDHSVASQEMTSDPSSGKKCQRSCERPAVDAEPPSRRESPRKLSRSIAQKFTSPQKESIAGTGDLSSSMGNAKTALPKQKLAEANLNKCDDSLKTVVSQGNIAESMPTKYVNTATSVSSGDCCNLPNEVKKDSSVLQSCDKVVTAATKTLSTSTMHIAAAAAENKNNTFITRPSQSKVDMTKPKVSLCSPKTKPATAYSPVSEAMKCVPYASNKSEGDAEHRGAVSCSSVATLQRRDMKRSKLNDSGATLCSKLEKLHQPDNKSESDSLGRIRQLATMENTKKLASKTFSSNQDDIVEIPVSEVIPRSTLKIVSLRRKDGTQKNVSAESDSEKNALPAKLKDSPKSKASVIDLQEAPPAGEDLDLMDVDQLAESVETDLDTSEFEGWSSPKDRSKSVTLLGEHKPKKVYSNRAGQLSRSSVTQSRPHRRRVPPLKHLNNNPYARPFRHKEMGRNRPDKSAIMNKINVASAVNGALPVVTQQPNMRSKKFSPSKPGANAETVGSCAPSENGSSGTVSQLPGKILNDFVPISDVAGTARVPPTTKGKLVSSTHIDSNFAKKFQKDSLQGSGFTLPDNKASNVIASSRKSDFKSPTEIGGRNRSVSPVHKASLFLTPSKQIIRAKQALQYRKSITVSCVTKSSSVLHSGGSAIRRPTSSNLASLSSQALSLPNLSADDIVSALSSHPSISISTSQPTTLADTRTELAGVTTRTVTSIKWPLSSSVQVTAQRPVSTSTSSLLVPAAVTAYRAAQVSQPYARDTGTPTAGLQSKITFLETGVSSTMGSTVSSAVPVVSEASKCSDPSLKRNIFRPIPVSSKLRSEIKELYAKSPSSRPKLDAPVTTVLTSNLYQKPELKTDTSKVALLRLEAQQVSDQREKVIETVQACCPSDMISATLPSANETKSPVTVPHDVSGVATAPANVTISDLIPHRCQLPPPVAVQPPCTVFQAMQTTDASSVCCTQSSNTVALVSQQLKTSCSTGKGSFAVASKAPQPFSLDTGVQQPSTGNLDCSAGSLNQPSTSFKAATLPGSSAPAIEQLDKSKFVQGQRSVSLAVADAVTALAHPAKHPSTLSPAPVVKKHSAGEPVTACPVVMPSCGSVSTISQPELPALTMKLPAAGVAAVTKSFSSVSTVLEQFTTAVPVVKHSSSASSNVTQPLSLLPVTKSSSSASIVKQPITVLPLEKPSTSASIEKLPVTSASPRKTSSSATTMKQPIILVPQSKISTSVNTIKESPTLVPQTKISTLATTIRQPDTSLPQSKISTSATTTKLPTISVPQIKTSPSITTAKQITTSDSVTSTNTSTSSTTIITQPTTSAAQTKMSTSPPSTKQPVTSFPLSKAYSSPAAQPSSGSSLSSDVADVPPLTAPPMADDVPTVQAPEPTQSQQSPKMQSKGRSQRTMHCKICRAAFTDSSELLQHTLSHQHD